jgi:hypothetical protein
MVTRKSLLLAVAIVLALAGSAGAGLVIISRHEPTFYRRTAVPPGEGRRRLSGEFVTEFARLIDGVLNKKWNARFTEEQINSYLEEDFLRQHTAECPLPEGISEPRIALDTNRIRLGFRYGAGHWNTVISLDIHVWLVPKETNLVAFEFLGMHAGAMPISAHGWLERQLDGIRRRNIDASWYRHHGHPVLLLRFQADRSTPTFRLQELNLHPGLLSVTGHSIESAPQDAVSQAIDGLSKPRA